MLIFIEPIDKEKFEDIDDILPLADIVAGYRPILYESNYFNDYNSLVEFLNSYKEYINIKDELNIMVYSTKQFLELISFENKKNTTDEDVSILGDEVDEISLSEFDPYAIKNNYIDDNHYVWLRLSMQKKV